MRPLRSRILPAFLSGALVVSPLALAGCDNEGPAEGVGEKIDEGAKDTKRAVDDATD